MVNVEYRWEAFSALDMAFFTDWQVARSLDRRILSLGEHAYGIGFRVIAVHTVVF